MDSCLQPTPAVKSRTRLELKPSLQTELLVPIQHLLDWQRAGKANRLWHHIFQPSSSAHSRAPGMSKSQRQAGTWNKPVWSRLGVWVNFKNSFALEQIDLGSKCKSMLINDQFYNSPQGKLVSIWMCSVVFMSATQVLPSQKEIYHGRPIQSWKTDLVSSSSAWSDIN